MNYKSPKVKAWGVIGLVIVSIVFVLIATFSLIGERVISGRYEDFFVSKDEYKDIKKERAETTLISAPKVTIDGQTPFIDKDGVWYYSLVEESETARNPKISLKVANFNYHLAIKETPLSEDNIQHNTEFKIMVYTKDSYQVFTMHVTTLPILSIEYDEEKAKEQSKLAKDEATQTSSSNLMREFDTELTLTLFDNRKDAQNRTIASNGVFHPRGNISYGYPKQNYKLSLRTAEGSEEHNDIALLGLREDDDFILNSAYYDPEKIRTVFEMNLWAEASGTQNSLGVTNGVEYRYVELFENKEYWGLYQLGFPIDEKQLDLAKTDDGLYTEPLFKKIGWDVNRTTDDDHVPTDWEIKNSIQDYVATWKSLLNYEKLIKNPTGNTQTIRQQTDMQSAIDLALFINLTQNYDISLDKDNLYNAYLSFHNKDGKTIALYTPWDVDLSFGHYLAGEIAETTYVYRSSKNVDETLTPAHALQRGGDKTIDQELSARYHELRNTYWSEAHIDELLDKYEAQIYNSGAFRRDIVRWPESRHNSEGEQLDFFRNYVHERLAYMDQYILDLENGKYDYTE